MVTKKYDVVAGLTLFLSVIFILTLPTAEASESFSSGFNHLLEITTDKTKSFDVTKIETIIEYVDSDAYRTTPDYSGGIQDSQSAYYGYSLNCSMKQILRICYNPKIPACAILPENIRLSTWEEEEPSELWKELNAMTENIIIKGSSYMQNTPDTSTGAYYGYDSLSTSILMKYNTKTVYISVSKQKDISEVGKKGFVLGNYDDLNYFYSGQPGLNKFGLGGIKSYLYDGFSVSVYIESEKDKNRIHCGTFKWLNGGWAGLNIIKKKHIYNGLKRFADSQKVLLESGRFPNYETLVSICAKYDRLSDTEMKQRMGRYFFNLQQECNSGENCPALLKKGFNPDEYIDTMSKEEMRSALIVENIKFLINGNRDKNERIISFNH